MVFKNQLASSQKKKKNQLAIFFKKNPKLFAKTRKIGNPTIQAQDQNSNQIDQD